MTSGRPVARFLVHYGGLSLLPLTLACGASGGAGPPSPADAGAAKPVLGKDAGPGSGADAGVVVDAGRRPAPAGPVALRFDAPPVRGLSLQRASGGADALEAPLVLTVNAHHEALVGAFFSLWYDPAILQFEGAVASDWVTAGADGIRAFVSHPEAGHLVGYVVPNVGSGVEPPSDASLCTLRFQWLIPSRSALERGHSVACFVPGESGVADRRAVASGASFACLRAE